MISQLIWPLIMQFLITVLITGVTAFFAVHAVQRIADPHDRASWLLIIVPFTILGSAFYFFTKYRKFKRIGKGGLIRHRSSKTFKEMLDLTDAERA
jgi:hypothetical protein